MSDLDRRLCVAPMMDWTDRHCRVLHRLYAPHALLYTEMIVAAAIVRGDARRLLDFDACEQPLALQLGGCDPQELAQAARIGASMGYREINLNVGCPSDRVRSGSFGACLMRRPALVAECVKHMQGAVSIPVTIKCRIGIDDQDDYQFFERFVDTVMEGPVDALIVHARVAILGGLSPKENREIPPLKYHYVHRLQTERPRLPLVINGGFTELAQIRAQSERGLGVMLGRAAYHHPELLAQVEQALFDPTRQIPDPAQIVRGMASYARAQLRQGVRLHSITRHMHGVMAGREGARAWRRFLSQIAVEKDAGADRLYGALALLDAGLAA